MRADRFEATFSLRRNVTSANGCSLRFIFNADDQDGYNYLELFHRDTAQAPDGYAVVDGKLRLAASGTQTVRLSRQLVPHHAVGPVISAEARSIA